MRNLIKIAFFFPLFWACEKSNETNPIIHSVVVGPTLIKSMEDSVKITLSYEDPDGDLGENSPGVKNLEIIDSRNQVSYWYRIPELSPSGSEIHIQGKLEVIIPQLVISQGKTSETFTLSAQITDRAGNLSESVSSQELEIKEP